MKKTDTYGIALSAMLSALGAVLVIMGGFFEIIDLSAASLACLAVLVAREELGAKRALAVYAVSSVASLIFMPLRPATLYYVLFLGYYPLVKAVIEKHTARIRILGIVLKLALFNLCVAVLAFITIKFVGIEEAYTPTMAVITIVAANIFLFAYDMFLNVMAIIYRHRFKGKLFR